MNRFLCRQSDGIQSAVVAMLLSIYVHISVLYRRIRNYNNVCNEKPTKRNDGSIKMHPSTDDEENQKRVNNGVYIVCAVCNHSTEWRIRNGDLLKQFYSKWFECASHRRKIKESAPELSRTLFSFASIFFHILHRKMRQYVPCEHRNQCENIRFFLLLLSACCEL